jgi:hypothetical protein
VRREELPFVRSFASSFVRLLVRPFVCSRGIKKNDNAVKSNDEGKKEQK